MPWPSGSAERGVARIPGCREHSWTWDLSPGDDALLPDPLLKPAPAGRGSAACARLSLIVGLLQCLDVELVHLQHGLHDVSCFPGVLVLQHRSQNGGNDLPRQTIPVLQPAASLLLSALGELLP